MKTFYRLANNKTGAGLWYDMKGKFTGLIHTEFNFCKNSSLPMPYDQNIQGYLSATETVEELYNWFSKEEIEKLSKHGYRILKYKSSDYKKYNNHWVINKNKSIEV